MALDYQTHLSIQNTRKQVSVPLKTFQLLDEKKISNLINTKL